VSWILWPLYREPYSRHVPPLYVAPRRVCQVPQGSTKHQPSSVDTQMGAHRRYRFLHDSVHLVEIFLDGEGAWGTGVIVRQPMHVTIYPCTTFQDSWVNCRARRNTRVSVRRALLHPPPSITTATMVSNTPTPTSSMALRNAVKSMNSARAERLLLALDWVVVAVSVLPTPHLAR